MWNIIIVQLVGIFVASLMFLCTLQRPVVLCALFASTSTWKLKPLFRLCKVFKSGLKVWSAVQQWKPTYLMAWKHSEKLYQEICRLKSVKITAIHSNFTILTLNRHNFPVHFRYMWVPLCVLSSCCVLYFGSASYRVVKITQEPQFNILHALHWLGGSR